MWVFDSMILGKKLLTYQNMERMIKNIERKE
jgi:hypothetical protein